MVQFYLIFDDKVSIETIDEAEATPGASRQYTRFNSECKSAIENVINKTKSYSFTLAMNCMGKILSENHFKVAKIDQGYPKNRAKITLVSTEK